MSPSRKNGSLLPSTTMVNGTLDHDQAKRVLEPYLVILSGCDRGRQFKLEQQSYVIGRSDEADIVIGDPKISRRHCVFTVFKDRRILFEDLQSTNGSFLGGERIEKHWLTMQDRILAGDTVMRIDYKCYSEAESEQALYRAAYTDALTGILNRGAFMQRAHEEFSFCKRNNALLSIVMCDVDHFKRKNDTYGHPAGDQVLKDLSAILSEQMRKEDLLARYGGEEFIMLLRETPVDAAIGWAERIREAVMCYPFNYQGQTIPTTISIGVCTRRISAVDSLPTIIRIADDALYLAKQNGRNRLEIAQFNSAAGPR
ncbi:GGDEF domain-containing protein [Methylomonas methanica]|uniref:diguanylate cyclase n=1 Tax=Methylomonas methanica (strain DSM 25384 / MC09) TaxID=857087 RepID=G0A5W9_METMM|nr:GGDEF domain-containing protein [Methylomonas methanica]AEF99246.1 diguanylate cyclase [Methylomonas methanica MC09]